jgi:hypothetical protein
MWHNPDKIRTRLGQTGQKPDKTPPSLDRNQDSSKECQGALSPQFPYVATQLLGKPNSAIRRAKQRQNPEKRDLVRKCVRKTRKSTLYGGIE